MVTGLAALLLQGSSSAWAQDASKTPSPKELWEAYPLEPSEAPPTATPSPELGAGARVTATPTATPAASSDDGGVPLAVPIGLAALLAFGAGAGLGLHRRRERPAEESPVAADEPPEPQSFPRRHYPEPARPAPPPPPVPGQRGLEFTDEPEPERVPTGRFKQKEKEPH
jgi:hypothetical protein